MRKPIILATAGLIAIGATAAWKIQHDLQEEQDGLLARAAISSEQARSTALAAHPGAKITESEIEEENGRLIYSFDLRAAGGDGEIEVEVDAMTGELLPSEVDDDDDGGPDDDGDRG